MSKVASVGCNVLEINKQVLIFMFNTEASFTDRPGSLGRELQFATTCLQPTTLTLTVSTGRLHSSLTWFTRLHHTKAIEVFMQLTAGWPDPAPLKCSVPVAQPLDLKLVPKRLQPMVKDVAELTSTPPDMAAAAAIACLGACVNRRAYIRPEGSNWRVVPCIWAAVVGLPGTGKTPAMNSFTKLLTGFERFWVEAYELELKEWQKEADEYNLKKRAYDELFKAWYKKPEGRDKPNPVPDLREQPTCRRLVVNDATTEKLHTLFKENPAGLFMSLDELAHWLASLDKRGYEQARTFYLTTWAVSGDAQFTLDRVWRGSVVAEVCLSLLGNLQPDTLLSYLGSTSYTDGLLQRMQVLVWPEPTPYVRQTREADANAQLKVERTYENLLNIDYTRPLEFKFAATAQPLFNKWRDRLEEKIRDRNMNSAFASHLAKYRSLVPALSLLFELADRKKGSTDFRVSPEHLQQAMQFAAYLENHAHKVYWHMTPRQGVEVATNELSKRLKHGDLGSAFTVRTVYRNEWVGLKNVANVKAACEELVEAGWLRPLSSIDNGDRLARPELFKQKVDYLVNPKVLKGVKP